MAIFYVLHNILPLGSKESGLTDGQRNCRLFLMGVFLYVILFIYMKNIQLAGVIEEEWYDTIKVGFYVLILSDVFVMSFIYKDWYGRSILNEVDDTLIKKTSDFEYDENEHKYKIKDKDKYKEKEKNLVDNIFVTKNADLEINSKGSKGSKGSKSSKGSKGSKHQKHQKHINTENNEKEVTDIKKSDDIDSKQSDVKEYAEKETSS
jgi:hypothetical protein